MTMVPRTGPFSASSARATTSWYHRGKSSDRAVTAPFLGRGGPGASVGSAMAQTKPGPTPARSAGGQRGGRHGPHLLEVGHPPAAPALALDGVQGPVGPLHEVVDRRPH